MEITDKILKIYSEAVSKGEKHAYGIALGEFKKLLEGNVIITEEEFDEYIELKNNKEEWKFKILRDGEVSLILK